MIGVGASQSVGSSAAGREAACAARATMGTRGSSGWALVFSAGRHDPDAVLEGLRAELGDVDVVGGSAVGTITGDSLGYTGYECAVAVFPAVVPKPVIVVTDMRQGERAAGRGLGAKLRDSVNDGETVLLFYDSVRSTPPPVLHVGSVLVDGVYEGLAGKEITLVGGGMIGDHRFSQSYVFDGRRWAKHAAVAVVLPPVLKSHSAIMHGCIPVSSFMEITRIDGPVVREIDGRPAVEALLGVLGSDGSEEALERMSLTVTLGQKHGDPFAPYDESAYVNRLIMNADRENGGITLFEADFEVGTKVQVMSRDNRMMVDSVRERTRESLASLGRERAVLALYIDCAGRCSSFSGAEIEEASVLQGELGPAVPLLGFYSGVEIAPLLGRSRPLDWTGVLTLFTLDEKT